MPQKAGLRGFGRGRPRPFLQASRAAPGEGAGMDALDLTKQPPRAPREMLPGLNLLMIARTVDKLRATLPGGNSGDYKIAGFSERVLNALDIEEAAMRDAVAAAKNDAEIAAWVAAHSDASRFDAVNAAISAAEDRRPHRRSGIYREVSDLHQASARNAADRRARGGRPRRVRSEVARANSPSATGRSSGRRSSRAAAASP